MRVLVCGGRDFSDREAVYAELSAQHAKHRFTHLIHGCARGADALAGEWADDNAVNATCYMADWARHGKAAGPMRNREMLEDGKPDLVIAFPGGAGTRNMVDAALSAGVECIEWWPF